MRTLVEKSKHIDQIRRETREERRNKTRQSKHANEPLSVLGIRIDLLKLARDESREEEIFTIASMREESSFLSSSNQLPTLSQVVC
jgi:hypothetical protein